MPGEDFWRRRDAWERISRRKLGIAVASSSLVLVLIGALITVGGGGGSHGGRLRLGPGPAHEQPFASDAPGSIVDVPPGDAGMLNVATTVDDVAQPAKPPAAGIGAPPPSSSPPARAAAPAPVPTAAPSAPSGSTSAPAPAPEPPPSTSPPPPPATEGCALGLPPLLGGCVL